MMPDQQGHTLRVLTAILIFIGLVNISSCKFDLMGGDPINQDNSKDGGNSGNGAISNFQPAVFTAARAGTKLNEPFELLSSFEDGSEITELTGIISPGGTGDKYKVSPDGMLVAYLTNQNSGRFELFVVPVEGGNPTPISPLLSDNGDVVEFKWSPDSSKIAYLADVAIDERFELYANLAEGRDNRKVSGSLPIGGQVTVFEWSADSLRLGYIADQNNFGEFELI